MVTKVVPNVDDLAIELGSVCTYENCSRVLPNSSSLKMHMVKKHGVDANSVFNAPKDAKKTSEKAFYCPIETCKRSINGDQPFKKLGNLKQHFHTMHGEKKFACRKCRKLFALADACRRHETECGQTFLCSCGEQFRSMTSLNVHARRHKHVPSTAKRRARETTENSSSKRLRRIFPKVEVPPILILNQSVNVIPTIDSSCQTTNGLYVLGNPTPVDSVSTAVPAISTGTQSVDSASLTGLDSAVSSASTQTITDAAVGASLNSLEDESTQTAFTTDWFDSLFDSDGLLSVASQTDITLSQPDWCEIYEDLSGWNNSKNGCTRGTQTA